eukprot:CAMPEP_0204577688 /NCGR_PEP_ID=MMETSP0661-20131031/42489_1 /ASSEMBLY_ACC=CAM_ASM_000606 /TAXON_ID=109239 /ORGANISM="Alexandrium margalefi, Strain AMGDE01CS-322" /LENGTH=270 /DNA_ID=CAMNT_0051586547 /DNA_START=96 /DNA_END=906 /DNA_ORIENTATION=+
MTDAVAHELKWMLMNDMWAVANSARAWTLVKKKYHKELAQKALEDSQRAGQHARKAAEMGVLSGDAIRVLRTMANAAGNEVARFLLHRGEFEQKFDQSPALVMESGGVRNDTLFVNKGWETMMDAIRHGAAHIYYTEMRKKDKADDHKAEVDKLLKNWATMAKINMRDRDELNMRLAKEAAERAMQEATANDKATEKAAKKALELRSKYHAELSKKAKEAKQEWMQKQQAQAQPTMKAIKAERTAWEGRSEGSPRTGQDTDAGGQSQAKR